MADVHSLFLAQVVAVTPSRLYKSYGRLSRAGGSSVRAGRRRLLQDGTDPRESVATPVYNGASYRDPVAMPMRCVSCKSPLTVRDHELQRGIDRSVHCAEPGLPPRLERPFSIDRFVSGRPCPPLAGLPPP